MDITASLHVPALVLAAAVLLTGCGDEGAEDPAAAPSSSAAQSPTTAAPSTGDCPEVIPDDVFAILGWQPGGGAVEGRGGCTWDGPEGSITVFESANDYLRACELLADAAPDATFQDQVAGLTDGSACGYDRGTTIGQSELALEVDSGSVSIAIAALVDTPTGAVQDALLALTTTADELS